MFYCCIILYKRNGPQICIEMMLQQELITTCMSSVYTSSIMLIHGQFNNNTPIVVQQYTTFLDKTH